MLDTTHPAVLALIKGFSSDGTEESFRNEFPDIVEFVVPVALTLPRNVQYFCETEAESCYDGWEEDQPAIERTWRHANGYGGLNTVRRGNLVGVVGYSNGCPGAGAPGFTLLPTS